MIPVLNLNCGHGKEDASFEWSEGSYLLGYNDVNGVSCKEAAVTCRCTYTTLWMWSWVLGKI